MLFQQKIHIKVGNKFVCASCNASYVGQTCPYLTIRIDEDFGKNKKSHTYISTLCHPQIV